MSIEKPNLPDDFPQQVVADMEQRAIDAGTTLDEVLRRALATQRDTVTPDSPHPEDL